MIYLIIIFCIIGIIYIFNKDNQKVKKKTKNHRSIKTIKANFDKEDNCKNRIYKENISPMEEWDPEGYKKLMSEDNFISQLTNKTIKKNVQNTPKNQLLKRILDGETISCKSLAKKSNFNWYIAEIKNDRAIGFLLLNDNHEINALSKTFDVKIASDGNVTLSYSGWTDKYNINTFIKKESISIKYFLTDSESDMYLIKNVEIELQKVEENTLYKSTASEKNVFYICKVNSNVLSRYNDKNANIYRLGVTSKRLSSKDDIENILIKSCCDYGDTFEIKGVFHTEQASRLDVKASEFGSKANIDARYANTKFRVLSDLDVENILELADGFDNKIEDLDTQDKKLENINFVYIWRISNRNWFNEDMYKIGLTKGKNLHKIKNVSHQTLTVCNNQTVFDIDVIGTYKTEDANNLIKKLLNYGKLPNIEGCIKSTKIRIFNDEELNAVLQLAENSYI